MLLAEAGVALVLVLEAEEADRRQEEAGEVADLPCGGVATAWTYGPVPGRDMMEGAGLCFGS